MYVLLNNESDPPNISEGLKCTVVPIAVGQERRCPCCKPIATKKLDKACTAETTTLVVSRTRLMLNCMVTSGVGTDCPVQWALLQAAVVQECLNTALTHRVWILCDPVRPGVELDDLCGSLPTQDIL